MTLGGPVPADSNELRRELASLRGQIASLQAWRAAVRTALSQERAYGGGASSAALRSLIDALHDCTDEEIPPNADTTMRVSIDRTHVLRVAASHPGAVVTVDEIPLDKRPTDRVPRTTLGGSRPGHEEEDDGG